MPLRRLRFGHDQCAIGAKYSARPLGGADDDDCTRITDLRGELCRDFPRYPGRCIEGPDAFAEFGWQAEGLQDRPSFGVRVGLGVSRQFDQ